MRFPLLVIRCGEALLLLPLLYNLCQECGGVRLLDEAEVGPRKIVHLRNDQPYLIVRGHEVAAFLPIVVPPSQWVAAIARE